MGRAFRVLKRTAHLTVRVSERTEKVIAVTGGEAPKRRARAEKSATTASTRAAKKAKE
jgi:hypothetical protein